MYEKYFYRMAIQYGGILGTVVGKLGPVVGYRWRGRPVFRAYVAHIHYPDTALQQAERRWFVAMVRFASAARQALLMGFREAALRAGMTEGNYFVLSNKRFFHRAPAAASDGQQLPSPRVDYDRLVLSKGPVAPVLPTSRTVDPDGVLVVGFDRNRHQLRSRSSDRVYLYVHNATTGRGLLSAPVARSEGSVAMRLPDGWAAHDLHCYLFAVDRQGRASASAYVSPEASPDDLSCSTAVLSNPPVADGASPVPAMPAADPDLPVPWDTERLQI